MRINFFEEYPTPQNMSKLDLINWPSTLLVAAPSLIEFENIRKKYANKYPHITFGWWPTIPDSYWVSGLVNTQDLNFLFKQLTSKIHKKELPILIDFELPIKKHLYLKNLHKIRRNKKIISKFLEGSNKFNLKVYTAEYPSINMSMYLLWRILGVSPSLKFKHTKIPMCYSSMKPRMCGSILWNKTKKFENKLAKKHPNRINFGLGAIANGVYGNEPILSAEELRKDIEWAQKSNISEVFVFRLAGITQSHIEIFK
jgi:hypothetical protein